MSKIANYSSLRSDCLYDHQENFKTLLAVFIDTILLLLDMELLVYGENDRTQSLFVYNMQLYIQQLKSYCLNFFKFSHMVPNKIN